MTERAEIDGIITRMWAHSSGREIAQAAGVASSTVSRRAQELGLPSKGAIPGVDDRIREQWATSTPDKIAQFIGVETSTVKRRAKAMGLIPPKPPKPPRPVAEPRPTRPLSGGNLKRKMDARADDGPRLDYAPLPPARPAGPNARILADAPFKGACRFPVGEVPDGRADLQLFCNEPATHPRGRYCLRCAGFAYRPKKESKK